MSCPYRMLATAWRFKAREAWSRPGPAATYFWVALSCLWVEVGVTTLIGWARSTCALLHLPGCILCSGGRWVGRGFAPPLGKPTGRWLVWLWVILSVKRET